MVKRGVKYLIRCAAAVLLIAYGPVLVSSSAAYAAVFAGCAPDQSMGCITRHATYEDKICIDVGEFSQEAASCVSCNEQANHICTWCGGDLEGHFNPSSFPSCDTGGGGSL
jgi:hypothetical protein